MTYIETLQASLNRVWKKKLENKRKKKRKNKLWELKNDTSKMYNR